MVSTIALDDLEKYVENVYEAIVVIAKRARQINDEQKQVIEEEMQLGEELLPPSEEYDEDEVDKRALERDFPKLPKPTKIAVHEMLDGKLKFEYVESAGAEEE
jgi:DNA-directed RNA polymerase omega subunit